MPQMTEPFTRFQPVISRTQANMFSNTASSVADWGPRLPLRRR